MSHRLGGLGRWGLIVAAIAATACSRAPSASTAIRGSEPSPEPAERRLVVFAAASLTEAFSDIGRAFEESHPGSSVAFNFAGSQALRTQIEEGAVADVFASADGRELEPLIVSGYVEPEGSHEFARNRLVVILPQDNPAGIASLGDLARPGIKIVLAADEVPAGRYARQVLSNLNAAWGAAYAEAVLANVVSNEENVRQVVAKVSLAEADAGIVYSTDAGADPRLATVPIDNAYNVLASYPLATLAGAPHSQLAQQFVDFVLSAEGQAILASHGFLPPGPA